MKFIMKLVLLPFYLCIYMFKFMLWLILLLPLAIFNALAAPSGRR